MKGRTGNVPTAVIPKYISAVDLKPDILDLTEERNQIYGLNQRLELKLEEAWFMALRRAKRQFVRKYGRCADELLFSPEEAERVANLTQMREHVIAWREYVGAHAVLECGLPNMLRGLRVVVR